MIKKTYSSSIGKNIYKLFLKQIQKILKRIKKLYSEVIKSGFLFQETVKQHPDLNKLNPSSLNTIRIDTFINSDSKIDIISAYIRMSTNESHVDNIISGGCMVGINLQTGSFKKYGYSMIKPMGVKSIYRTSCNENKF